MDILTRGWLVVQILAVTVMLAWVPSAEATQGAGASSLHPPQDLTRPHPLTPVPIQQVVIQDDFWSPKLRVWREVNIPDCFTKFENDRTAASSNGK